MGPKPVCGIANFRTARALLTLGWTFPKLTLALLTTRSHLPTTNLDGNEPRDVGVRQCRQHQEVGLPAAEGRELRVHLHGIGARGEDDHALHLKDAF